MSRRFRLSPAILGLLFGPLMAAVPLAAEPRLQPADLEGRRQDARHDLTLDILRCGDRICGQVVDKEQKCGARALVATWRSEPGHDAPDEVAGGTLDMPGRGGLHKVRLMLSRAKGADKPSLHIYGAMNEEPSLYRRMIPLMLSLSRIGDPACTPHPAS